MAVCSSLPGAALHPLVPISFNTLQQQRVQRFSSSHPPSFHASRIHIYAPPLCRHQLAATASSETPPSSRDEALLQARSSISVFLDKALRDVGPTTVKRRSLQRQVLLRVELPLLDECDATRASLLSDLLSTLTVGKRGTSVSFSVCSSHGIVQQLKKQPRFSASSQEDPDPDHVKNPRFWCCNITENSVPDESQVIVILAPKLSNVADIVDIVKSGHPRPVLLLNPEWSAEEEEGEASYASFLQSFEVVYSYLPLDIQGFFSKTEGAVLKHVKSGAPAGRPWLVFAKEEESWKCVASLKKRPTTVDLENALYNAMAANSPVAKSIKFLRGLVGKS